MTTTRGGTLQDFKKPFARSDATSELKTLLEVIDAIKPTALIGLSGTPKSFDDESLKTMAKFNKIPIIFALSNPTSKSECTAQEAFGNTNGTCIFASGSPFEPVEINGKIYETGQGIKQSILTKRKQYVHFPRAWTRSSFIAFKKGFR